MSNLGVFPRDAENAGSVLPSHSALTWQIAGGTACLALLIVRATMLGNAHPAYHGSGGAALVGAAVTAELLGYLFYIPLGAWVATIVLRVVHPDLRYPQVFALFGTATMPLLFGWIVRAAVAWLRPAPAVATAGSFHEYARALWSAVELRTDPFALFGASPSAIAATLGIFWIWHAVVLASGLDRRLRVSRPWALAVLATLFGVVLVAHLAEASVAANWQHIVVWSD